MYFEDSVSEVSLHFSFYSKNIIAKSWVSITLGPTYYESCYNEAATSNSSLRKNHFWLTSMLKKSSCKEYHL